MEKVLKLDNGVELPYLELGEENEEVLVVGQFYFMTFMPWLEKLATYFHVYAVTMRTKEPITERTPDGKAFWSKIWANEFCEFAQKKGLKKFIYAGKCHGTSVGWNLMKDHADILKGFVALSLLPDDRDGYINPKFPEVWKYIYTDKEKFVRLNLRSENLIQLKIDEINTADVTGAHEGVTKPLYWIETNEELYDFYKNIKVPMLLQYGSEDPRLDEKMFMKAATTIPGAKSIMYQGERHFYEMDIPELLAKDAIEWAKGL